MNQEKKDFLNNPFTKEITDDFKVEFLEGLIPMAYHLNIDGNKLSDDIAYAYMKYIYENVSKSLAFISSHTGYKRTTVKNFKTKYEKTSLTPPKKETSIFNEFIHKLRAECNKDVNFSFPIHGINSCHSIFHSCKFSSQNTFTVNSVLSTLEKCGFIDVCDKNVIFLPSINEEHQRSKDDINRQFSNMVKDFSATQIHNMQEEDKDKRFFSQRINSIDIPDHLIPLVALQGRLTLREAQKKVFDRIEVNENTSEDASKDLQKNYQVSVQQFISIVKRGKS